jgi:hypothetical protein
VDTFHLPAGNAMQMAEQDLFEPKLKPPAYGALMVFSG